MVHYISTVEVYLPWKDTWLEFLPLPVQDPGHRMEETRIFSLYTNSGLKLHLLGGFYDLGGDRATYTSKVWRLLWRESNSSYYWSDEWDPAMGELHYPHLTTPTYRSLLL